MAVTASSIVFKLVHAPHDPLELGGVDLQWRSRLGELHGAGIVLFESTLLTPAQRRGWLQKPLGKHEVDAPEFAQFGRDFFATRIARAPWRRRAFELRFLDQRNSIARHRNDRGAVFGTSL